MLHHFTFFFYPFCFKRYSHLMKKPVQISNEEFKEKQYELSFLWWYDKKKPKQTTLTLKASSSVDLNDASLHHQNEGFINGETLVVRIVPSHFGTILLIVVWNVVFTYSDGQTHILALPCWFPLCTSTTYNLYEFFWRSLANSFVRTNFWGYKCDSKQRW